MGLTVVTPAPDLLLTTVNAVKSALGIALSDTSHDADILGLIENASDAICDVTERTWARQAYRETLPGSGGGYIVLSRYPIIATPLEILYYEEVVTDASVSDPAGGILYREAGWPESKVTQWELEAQPSTQEATEVISVTYEAGYNLPNHAAYGDGNGNDLPKRISRAALLAVCDWYRSGPAGASHGPITGKKVGDLSVTYADVSSKLASGELALPPGATALLPKPRPW